MGGKSMDDYELLFAIKNREEEKFDYIIKEYSKLLWVIGWAIIGKTNNKEDLEELISDVFLRFWNNPDKYDPKKGSIKNYLVLMMKSMALNKLRSNKNNLEVDEDFLLEIIPEEKGEGDSIWEIFFQATNQLKDPTKTICLQRFFLELKPAVISENLGLTIDETNRRLYKGKKKIRQLMTKLMNGGNDFA